MAILREANLDKYVTGSLKTRPDSTGNATEHTAWPAGEAKARTRLELAIGDEEMVHILGTTTAAEIWDRLCEVKETKGRLGILATRRALYRAAATESFDMTEHIATLRRYQAELALMENEISEEDFAMILISSLPESWDGFTSSYFGSVGSKKDETLKATQLIPLLLKEDRRCRTRDVTSPHALQARSNTPSKI